MISEINRGGRERVRVRGLAVMVRVRVRVVNERPRKDRSTRMCVTGLIRRSIYPQMFLCTLGPVIIPA